MKLTSDNRYIISCSNKFITFDVVTSDLARQVYPKVTERDRMAER